MNVELLVEPLKALLHSAGEFLPRLAIAVVVLVAGWLLAKAVRFAVVRGLRAINFNVLTERAGMDGFLAQGGISTDTTGIFGILVYWLIILATLVIAFNGLGLTYPDSDGVSAAHGVAPNELTASADRDWLAGTPWHKHVPARIEAA